VGVDYNFAEAAYPFSLISKRMLIGGDPGIIHTVPEPGTLVLLVIAGLIVGSLAWRSAWRQSRKSSLVALGRQTVDNKRVCLATISVCSLCRPGQFFRMFLRPVNGCRIPISRAKAQEAAMRFRNLFNRVAFCALVVCAVAILSTRAHGDLIPYAPVSGVHFDFTNIQEDPTRLSVPVSAEPVPKFGQPTGGDTLSFPALAFKSSATGGMDFADSKLSMTISSKTSLGIQSVVFSEFGDYTLARASTSSNPFAEAKAIGWVTVEEVNGLAISPFIVIPSLAGTQFDNQYNLSTGDLWDVAVSWNGSLNFDVAQAVLNEYGSGVATKVSFVLDNALFTQADTQGLAYIAKKGVSLSVVPVPEPSTLALLGVGVIGMLAYAWRRRRS
jgi:hypothetical protein